MSMAQPFQPNLHPKGQEDAPAANLHPEQDQGIPAADPGPGAPPTAPGYGVDDEQPDLLPEENDRAADEPVEDQDRRTSDDDGDTPFRTPDPEDVGRGGDEED